MAYEWHKSGIRVQANGIRMTYEWHASSIRNIKLQKERHLQDNKRKTKKKTVTFKKDFFVVTRYSETH